MSAPDRADTSPIANHNSTLLTTSVRAIAAVARRNHAGACARRRSSSSGATNISIVRARMDTTAAHRA